jgi:lipoprotein-releasing system ATP-binding protein
LADVNKMVLLENIKKAYPTSDSQGKLDVLKGINLQLNKGESLAIVGPSGSGKSTLLNLLGGLDQPDEGEIHVNGQSVKGLDEKALSVYRNKQLGFVFQLHHLLPQCTVLENVLLPTLMYPEKTREAYMEEAQELLKKVGLMERIHHKPNQISVGECQRTAVARAFINKPGLLLADEPTGSVDASNAIEIIKLIRELNQSHQLTTVLVTHSEKIAGYMDRTVQLENGVFK